jgi:hypothetical protein
MTTPARTGLQLRSTVKKEGLLELSLADVPIPRAKARRGGRARRSIAHQSV